MARWVRFRSDAGAGPVGFGTLDGDRIAVHEGDLFDHPIATGEHVAAGTVELMTPVDPSKMVALANNFHALIAKTGGSVPAEPDSIAPRSSA